MLLNPTPSAEQMIDSAFRRAKKAMASLPKDSDKWRQIRKEEATFVAEFGDYLLECLEKAVKDSPDFEALPPLLRELAKSTTDTTQLKKAISHLNETKKILKKIKYEHVKMIYASKRHENWDAASKKRKGFVGRAASLIRKAKPSISLYNDSARKLKELPTKELNAEDTIVLAGMPNAGKTTLFNKMTGSDAKVAHYAFTTTKLNIASFEKNNQKTTVIDTPGLLEKMPDKRNNSEKKAIAALKHGAKKLVFVIDPTGESFSLEQQMRLFEELKREFAEKQVFFYLSREDVAGKEEMEAAKKAATERNAKEYNL